MGHSQSGWWRLKRVCFGIYWQDVLLSTMRRRPTSFATSTTTIDDTFQSSTLLFLFYILVMRTRSGCTKNDWKFGTSHSLRVIQEMPMRGLSCFLIWYRSSSQEPKCDDYVMQKLPPNRRHQLRHRDCDLLRCSLCGKIWSPASASLIDKPRTSILTTMTDTCPLYGHFFAAMVRLKISPCTNFYITSN